MAIFKDDPALPNIVELRNIYQSYDEGRVKIIEGMDFLIEDKPYKGQFVVLLGMSGCGKSTVLRYIAGLQEPTQGTVLVKGAPVGDANRVNMVFQQYSSFPWFTVLENVALGLTFSGVAEKEKNERAMEMIEWVGLAGHEHKYAQYPLLSGGQLQRVAIARSLVSNPDVLLMDEPFGALDIETRQSMQDLLLSAWRKFNTTIVFVTHDIGEAVYLANDIYIMKKAPSKIVEHIPVTLPSVRSLYLKESEDYLKLVQDVEHKMLRTLRRGALD